MASARSRVPATDVLVIGGGASGLAAAITAARRGCSVTVIERDVACGLPILATGNGRCNLSNTHLDAWRYHHPDEVRSRMEPEPEQRLARFFDSLGICTTSIGDRLYPYSRRAESVRDALLGACERLGVTLRCGAELAGASFDSGSGIWDAALSLPAQSIAPSPAGKRKRDAHAELRAARRKLAAAPRVKKHVEAQSIVIATGHRVGGIAKLFTLPSIDPVPVLCPVACSPRCLGISLERLDGIRIEGALHLVRRGDALWEEQGEILFRPWGVSGIVAFNLSRRMRKGDTVEIDLFPALSETELEALLVKREHVLGSLEEADATWFDGLLARELGSAVLAYANMSDTAMDARGDAAAESCSRSGDAPAGHAPDRIERDSSARESGNPHTVDGSHVPSSSYAARCAHAAKHLGFSIQGPADEQAAQAHRGGIGMGALEPARFRVKSPYASNLFACGEALDVDADCGGFNLAWAWLSGMGAGAEAADTCRS